MVMPVLWPLSMELLAVNVPPPVKAISRRETYCRVDAPLDTEIVANVPNVSEHMKR